MKCDHCTSTRVAALWVNDIAGFARVGDFCGPHAAKAQRENMRVYPRSHWIVSFYDCPTCAGEGHNEGRDCLDCVEASVGPRTWRYGDVLRFRGVAGAFSDHHMMYVGNERGIRLDGSLVGKGHFTISPNWEKID